MPAPGIYSAFRVDGTNSYMWLDGGSYKPPLGDCAIYSEPTILSHSSRITRDWGLSCCICIDMCLEVLCPLLPPTLQLCLTGAYSSMPLVLAGLERSNTTLRFSSPGLVLSTSFLLKKVLAANCIIIRWQLLHFHGEH